jgi:hypothetical protein
MQPAQQLSLWSRVRDTVRPQRSRRPVAPPVCETPLSEKTLPAVGGLVRVIGDVKRTRYTVAGVMLCGPQCYVTLWSEGVTSGDMRLAKVEALTLT